MKVIGFSGSPRNNQTTDRLVQSVLSSIDGETEFVSLSQKKIAPCKACLVCAKDNVCIVKDDMYHLRQKILEADGFVIGAPNYFSLLNGITHNFLERWCQFRHQSGKLLAGKHAAIVSVGGIQPEIPAQQVKRILQYYSIHHIGTISAQGAASCFTCGYGEECEVGAVHMLYGAGTKITDELIPGLDKKPEKISEARALGENLSKAIQADIG